MERTLGISSPTRHYSFPQSDDENPFAELKGHCYTLIKNIGIGLSALTSRITDKNTGFDTICDIVKLAGRIFEGMEWAGKNLTSAKESSFGFVRFADCLLAVVDLISLFELTYDDKGEVKGVQVNREVIKSIRNKEYYVITKKVLKFALESLTVPLFLNQLKLVKLGTIAAKAIGKSVLGVYIAYHVVALIQAFGDIWHNRNPELACLKIICYSVEIALQIAIIASGIGMPAQIGMGVFSVALDIFIGTVEYHMNKQKQLELNKA